MYRVRLTGGERLRLAARVAGEVVLQVFDDCGRLVAEGAVCGATREVRFTPRRTGTFTVRLVNRDEDDVEYTLVAAGQ